MLEIFCPKIYVNHITEIDLKNLKNLGYNCLMLDLDNTIVSWGEEYINPLVMEWLDNGHKLDFKMCIISNSFSGRIKILSDKLGIPFVSPALKPRKSCFFDALNLIGGTPEEAIMIGDQIFTDILGGNRAGILTILVKPIHSKEFFTTKFIRLIEKLVIISLKNKGVFPINKE